MRVWLLVGLIPLVAACSTVKPATTPPSASLSDTSVSDVSGHWTGAWIGTGMFNSPREDTVTMDLIQRGDRGYGRLMFDGTIAAESVPEELRRQGLSGVRVFAEVNGSRMRLKHELGGQLFTADFKLMGDQMIGDVRGAAPGVRLLLTRASHPVAPEADKPQAAKVVPAAPGPSPTPSEQETAPRDIAAAMPSEPDAQPERPRQEDFAPVPELTAIHFDFDTAKLRADALDLLTTNAQWLKEHADTLVLIEGHCDERGTPEYNLALGDRRAKAVMQDLEARGIAADRISTISYGKERPVCTDSDTEACKSLNRRAEFRIKSR